MLGASGAATQANLTDISIVAVANLMLQWSFLSLPSVILLHPLSRAPPGHQDGYNYPDKRKYVLLDLTRPFSL